MDILGKHGVNIANFGLGRNENGAVAAVNVDDPKNEKLEDAVMKEICGLKAVKNAWMVRV